ncbi:serine/threonine protein kinase [Nocardia inohanensis]|uniref:serine/threonine protein kinase n=1 Tax=Nocardia inohanensis TaxID=209246 RepID=UPI0008358468|nr:serine/threonine protein kinase [Nocardia inohanensis]
MLEPGAKFAGYVIERELGRGGMGAVYLARHPRLPRWIALKLLNAEFHGDSETHARFEREADLAARLNHPGIVTVYDRGVENGRLWIAMQYVDGVEAESVPVEELPPARAVEIVTATAEALDYAHRVGVLHRDVKPANILLARETREQQPGVLLTDFGIARLQEDNAQLTDSGAVMATLSYASPEQLSNLPVDHRSDQYALACTLFRLLTGYMPFPATDPAAIVKAHLYDSPLPIASLRPGLPMGLDPVLARGLAKKPEERYRSCAEFAAAAWRAMEEAAGVARPPQRPAETASRSGGSGSERRAEPARQRSGGTGAERRADAARPRSAGTGALRSGATAAAGLPAQRERRGTDPGTGPRHGGGPSGRTVTGSDSQAQRRPGRATGPGRHGSDSGADNRRRAETAERVGAANGARRRSSSGRPGMVNIAQLFAPRTGRHLKTTVAEPERARRARMWAIGVAVACLAAVLGLTILLTSPSSQSAKTKSAPPEIAEISAAFKNVVPRDGTAGTGFSGATCRVVDPETTDFQARVAFDGWISAWQCTYTAGHDVQEYALFAYRNVAAAQWAASQARLTSSTVDEPTFTEINGGKSYTNRRFDRSQDKPSTVFVTSFFDDPKREKFLLFTRGDPATPSGVIDWWKTLPLTTG